ncbi:MAG TPA: HlyD family secretion protein [Candidatus Acidoferrum sp.]|nr:HlyD family secretion protein [Candidatus Acidoferrum sp.]
MAAASTPAPTPAASPAPNPATHPEPAPPAPKTSWDWLKYATPILVLLLAAAVLISLTRNWNAWEGGKAEQVTDDAFVRGDLTPLSTKVAGIVRSVKVTDYQRVHGGDLLVELQDDDFQAQLAQAGAAVDAAKAAIENNRRQRELQDSRIQRALAGIDQAKAQIAAAEAGINAVQADVVRTQAERTRQEALLATQAATKQKVESAVADEQRFAAQEASRKADLEQAKTALRSSEIAVESERRSKAVLESQDLQLIADLHAKEASLSVAKINLGYTKISAPADGTVGERQVRPGQLVSPGTQVVTFVPETKWVQANYRETQLTNMKVGDAAEIRVDQYPGKVFRGKVLEIAPASGSQFALLPPDNATGNFTKVVQRIPVKISFDDAKLGSSLRPGLSVIATVRTRQN